MVNNREGLEKLAFVCVGVSVSVKSIESSKLYGVCFNFNIIYEKSVSFVIKNILFSRWENDLECNFEFYSALNCPKLHSWITRLNWGQFALLWCLNVCHFMFLSFCRSEKFPKKLSTLLQKHEWIIFPGDENGLLIIAQLLIFEVRNIFFLCFHLNRIKSCLMMGWIDWNLLHVISVFLFML